MRHIPFKEKQTILFQGDSITDADRNRDDPMDMGHGYANMVSSFFNMLHPEYGVRFVNCAKSGSRISDLEKHWHSECIAHRPSWVSILVGVNDCGTKENPDEFTPPDVFAEKFRSILNRTQQDIGARIILCDPFALPVKQFSSKSFRHRIDEKISIVRELAREYHAIYVPLDGLFASSATLRSPEFWAPDGVHPSQTGHALIAHNWLRHVGAVQS